jgi:hypothetical protein
MIAPGYAGVIFVILDDLLFASTVYVMRGKQIRELSPLLGSSVFNEEPQALNETPAECRRHRSKRLFIFTLYQVRR